MPPRGRSKPSSDPFATLAASGPGPVYAVDGVQAQVDAFVRAVRAAVFPPGASGIDFNLDVFSGKEAALARVLDAAQTLPAFAPRRLVIVRQAEPLLEKKGSDDAHNALFAYLERPSPTTTLVLAASDKWDGRTKVYRALKKANALVRFDTPKEHEMPRLVQARAQETGVHIEPEAVRALVAGVGTNLGEAYQALERVALYVGPEAGRPVRREDVEAVVPTIREESIFALVDAIALGDRAAVARGLHHLVEVQRDHGLRVLALVVRQYRNLLRARAAEAVGVSRQELPSMLGVPPFAVERLLDQARRGDVDRFARSLASIATTDRALKGGSLGQLRTLERLALALREDVVLEP